MKSSTKTKQITEIIFDKEVNPFVSKKITENALGTCSYFENLNKNNIKDLSFKIQTDSVPILELKPFRGDEGRDGPQRRPCSLECLSPISS